MNELTSPDLNQYNYELPDEQIALHPLEKREDAKLLLYHKGEIQHQHFFDLPRLLPEDSLLVLNNTRVVRARLLFRRSTGAQIEVFCLEPVSPHKEMQLAMGVQQKTIWRCMVGNMKKWREGETLQMQLNEVDVLEAKLLQKFGREADVEFNWQMHRNWAEVLTLAGKVPLPPYIKRAADEEDTEQYQTVYAKEEGAVAAPTAGLHFSDELLQQLKRKNIPALEVTLHVSAGTFQPVEVTDVVKHPMHSEQLYIDKETIATLAATERKIIAVGTTSMRLLESLYWFGHEIIHNPEVKEFFVEKLQPYRNYSNELPDFQTSYQAVLSWMQQRNLETLSGRTEIFIFPPYCFHVCSGLITNFHLPQSTLLMLVSAFIGNNWKLVYQEALENNYRFLSYGDGSLLLP